MTNNKQLPLFPQKPDTGQTDEHYGTVKKDLIILRLDQSAEPQTSDQPRLALPRRWEFCLARAKEKHAVSSLIQTVRTPPRAIEELGHYIKLLQSSGGEGALWIFHGDAGSGKSTFLHTLESKMNLPGEEMVQVRVIRGNEVNLTSRLETYKYFSSIAQDRKSLSIALIIILEDVEVGLSDEELEALSQALKMVLRSPNPSESENVLVVIPVNNQKFGMRLRDVSREIGLLMRESGTSSLYVFEGPKEEEYIEIVEDLTRVLNGQPLADFGITREKLEKQPKRRVNIGDFIQNVVAIANEQDQRVAQLIRERQLKKLVTLFAFVRPIHPTELYNAVQLIVSDPDNEVSPRWLLDQAGAESNRWDGKSEKFAAIVHSVLNVKVVEFPPHILYLMIQMNGNKELQDRLKEHLQMVDINAAKPRNWTNVGESIASTNLMRLLISQQTKRPSHVSSMVPQDKDNNQTAQKRELLRKGVVCAKWVTMENQYNIHGAIALSLKAVLESGSHSAYVRGLLGVWAETPVGKYIRPDITIETSDTLYLLEFNYEQGETLTRADMARYIMKKINTYCDQLPFLKVLSQ